ncbi:MAG: glucosaminidase domain-containing protein [Candidatus Sericytochromatia bacterium]|nr:glucosaminidase domain-containing protein [Candidatus Tanganyikabacteria bacterium]
MDARAARAPSSTCRLGPGVSGLLACRSGTRSGGVAGGGPAGVATALAPDPGLLGAIGSALWDLLSRLARFVRNLWNPAPGNPAPGPDPGIPPPGAYPGAPPPTDLPLGPLPGPANPPPGPQPPGGSKPGGKPKPKPGPKPKPQPGPKPEPAPPAARKGSGPLLRRGSSGEAVKVLQRRLEELGFDPGPIDGEFGPRTQQAVKAFQRAERISVDGIVGPETWSHLGITVAKPKPPADLGSPDALRKVTPAQLAQWGATDKDRFFAALKPAAVEAEQKYGVPWQITLAQAALESGWGKHAIGGYNIFGIKGTGPAGSVAVKTQEYVNGRYITITAKFARYHDFYEAVSLHGKLFHNGYYDKALAGFKRDRSPVNFAKNIHGIYATSPVYAQSLIRIMQQYDLI